MKYFFIFLFFVLLVSSVFGQTESDSLINKLSLQVALRLKDSLNLNPRQGASVQEAEKLIFQRKLEARQLYGSDRQIIGRKIQEAENMRDSLYAQILNPEQFNRYKSRKGELTRIKN